MARDFVRRSGKRAGLGMWGPDLSTVDFGLDRVGMVGLVEEVTRSGALDSRGIWGSGQRLPPGCSAPTRGTAVSREA